MAFAVLALALLVSLILSGCSGDGDQDADGTTGTDRELLARASAALYLDSDDGSRGQLSYTDLAGAREQLGLPGDAAPGPRGKWRTLASFAARPLFMLDSRFMFDARLVPPSPLDDVFDGGRIEAAVSTNRAITFVGANVVEPESVIVLRTRQPFEEIAERLRDEGYAEADGLLVSEQGRPDCCPSAFTVDRVPFPAVGEADGVVVIGSVRATRAALEGADPELTPAATMLAELPGVARAVRGWRTGRACIVAFGFGEDAEPREGEARVLIDGEARAERALFLLDVHTLDDGGAGELALAEPAVDGGLMTVPFSAPERGRRPVWVPAETADMPYDCDGDWRGADPLSRVTSDAGAG